MNLTLRSLPVIGTLFLFSLTIFAGDAEYPGQFEKALVPNVEDFERVVFNFANNEQVKHLKGLDGPAHTTSGKLFDPRTGKISVRASLVEVEDEVPVVLVDLNGDGLYQENEQFKMEESLADNPFLWKATIPLPVNEGFFTSCPLFVRYFKRVKTAKMTENDRLLTQSTEVFARGSVDVKGKKVLVQYAYELGNKKISTFDSWMGVDTDENGEVDMDGLSPEAARAREGESVVFRAGQVYVSTKKVDLGKNLIVLREHPVKDYRRSELRMDQDFPDFDFTDFSGKKRKFSEFRGKYVLLDIWGLWCPPCQRELPYLRDSYNRFQGRNLEILGLNTDEQYTPGDIKKAMDKAGMVWPQAKFESVFDFLKFNLRISSYPTTFLISPEGKILSMSRSDRDEPDLRGEDLIETLDEILPKRSGPGGN